MIVLSLWNHYCSYGYMYVHTYRLHLWGIWRCKNAYSACRRYVKILRAKYRYDTLVDETNLLARRTYSFIIIKKYLKKRKNSTTGLNHHCTFCTQNRSMNNMFVTYVHRDNSFHCWFESSEAFTSGPKTRGPRTLAYPREDRVCFVIRETISTLLVSVT